MDSRTSNQQEENKVNEKIIIDGRYCLFSQRHSLKSFLKNIFQKHKEIQKFKNKNEDLQINEDQQA